ncbi:MAG: LicD family protein [Clostridia bacterium]|nr:LicD family protein [Clostridia bacterium]
MSQTENTNINELVQTATDCALSALSGILPDKNIPEGFDEKLRAELSCKLTEQQERSKTLRKLQQTELEILKEIDRICRKHNLRYYIVGGTLIGAVRHGGFIPWDDDIDISMPREDFDKLCKISAEELSDKYFLQTYKKEKDCYFYYAKVRMEGTYFGEDKFEHMSIHKGIFIDIFPLDYIPQNTAMQKIIFRGFSCLGGFICSKAKTTEFLYKNMSLPFIVTFRLIQCILPKKVFLGMRTILGKLSNAFSKKNLYASLSGFHGYPMEIAPKEWWGDGCDIEFEDVTVRAPSQYHTLLTHMFGDYMQLPPEEERVNHSVEPDKIIFEGCTREDYKPKIKRKRSHRYYGCDYDVYPIEDKE